MYTPAAGRTRIASDATVVEDDRNRVTASDTDASSGPRDRHISNA